MTSIQRRKAVNPVARAEALRVSGLIPHMQPCTSFSSERGEALAWLGSMHDGTLHAAADLMAFTSQASDRVEASALSLPLLNTQATDAPKRPLSCLYENLSPHFLPLDLNSNQNLQDQSQQSGATCRLQSLQQSDISQSASQHILQSKLSLSQPADAQRGGTLAGEVAGTVSVSHADGLPAVERYSRMIATVLQPHQESRLLHSGSKRDAHTAGVAVPAAISTSSGLSVSGSSGIVATSVAAGSGSQQQLSQLGGSPVKKQRVRTVYTAEHACQGQAARLQGLQSGTNNRLLLRSRLGGIGIILLYVTQVGLRCM